MVRAVVDASIVVKWFLGEEFAAKALQLRDDYAAHLIDLDAPAVLPFEVLNALRFAGVFTSDELRRSGESLDRLAIGLHHLRGPLAEASLDIASSRGLTVYDASYVALAHHLGVACLTADMQLLRAIRDVAEGVHIRDYRSPEGGAEP